MHEVKHGDLVRRKKDPVNTGRVFRVRGRAASRETSVDVVWIRSGKTDNTPPTIERNIPVKELEAAEEWK
jgi:hypothetical protein